MKLTGKTGSLEVSRLCRIKATKVVQRNASTEESMSAISTANMDVDVKRTESTRGSDTRAYLAKPYKK